MLFGGYYMSDKNCQLSQNCSNEVCIQTKKVYDSCKDKECIENLRVYLTEAGQCLVDRAVRKKEKKAVKRNDSVLFDEICEEIFTNSISSSVLGSHFMIMNPSEYGIEFDEDAYGFGETNIDNFKEAEKENAEYLDRINSINRNFLSEQQLQPWDLPQGQTQ